MLFRSVSQSRYRLLQMCFMLVGYNTTFEEDWYRFRRLVEAGIKPYVMVYNKKPDERLRHFARYVNSAIYKACDWEDYRPWIKVRDEIRLEC